MGGVRCDNAGLTLRTAKRLQKRIENRAVAIRFCIAGRFPYDDRVLELEVYAVLTNG
jgi:hypothetical protein